MLRSFVTSVITLVAAVGLLQAAGPNAEILARAANKARNDGQIVRAYLLFAEAAVLEPGNQSYRVNRDGLKPAANLLSKAGVEKEPSHEELLKSVPDFIPAPNVDDFDIAEQERVAELQPRPTIQLSETPLSFDLKKNERDTFSDVAAALGLQIVFDPQFDSKNGLHFAVEKMSPRDVLRSLTDETNTFLFALTPHSIFVARDTQQKRDEYEPEVAFTVPLVNLIDDKGLSEISNAVRQAFDLRHISFNTGSRSIVIRDKISKAAGARVMLESLVHASTQVSLDVKILIADQNSMLTYGLDLPNQIPLINFGAGGLKNAMLSLPQNFVNYMTFGGGSTLFGFGVTNITAVAMSSNSKSQSIYDATVVVSSGQTAELHVGDKYPIATSLIGGAASQGQGGIYNAPQTETVDLGIVLKVKPQLHANGDVSMLVRAEYRALGNRTFNTVPEILERQFEGNVRVHVGEAAILAGLDAQTKSVTRSGVAGLSELPKIGDLFTETTRGNQDSHTLLLLTPHSTRTFEQFDSPEYYFGGERGRKVLL